MVEKRDDHRPEPDDIDPDAPASAEEIAASQRLRDALEGVLGARGAGGSGAGASPEVALALSLRAAWDPAALSVDESRAVLDATPSAEEQELAAQLREALAEAREPRAGDPADYQLARALRSAFAPAVLDEAEHRAIIEAALAKLPARKSETTEKQASNVIAFKRRQTLVRVAFGVVTGGLALAASIVLVITSAPPAAEAPLARARTTQPLFSEPFKPGETSARIDRIASARASDFRNNRFTKWGVR
jgi:hypothetical protein